MRVSQLLNRLSCDIPNITKYHRKLDKSTNITNIYVNNIDNFIQITQKKREELKYLRNYSMFLLMNILLILPMDLKVMTLK